MHATYAAAAAVMSQEGQQVYRELETLLSGLADPGRKVEPDMETGRKGRVAFAKALRARGAG